jgi:DNA-directed RNA polymerase subunit beta
MPKPDVRPIITYPDEVRQNIYSKVKSALEAKFPIEGTTLVADIANVDVIHKSVPHSKQKKIRLGKGNASTGVFADIILKDKSTGKTIETLRHHRIMNIPYYTDRYTFIVDGNEYNLVNQLRTKSGVYTRRRGNDELETSFNLAAGANFKIIMDPESGRFKMSILHATLPLLAVLKVLGADDGKIKASLGEDLYNVNTPVTASQLDKTLDTLFTKLVQYKSNLGEHASKAEKTSAVRAFFANTKLDPETTRLTLGTSHSKVTVDTILQSMRKMLRVYNDKEDVDDRDGLEFQKVFTPDDLIKEVLDKSTREVAKIKDKLNSFAFSNDMKPGSQEASKKLKAIFSPATFTKPIRSFLTTSSISRLPDQINPMEIMDGASIVTRLGEGAISSEQAVPDETRAVNYSYMGLIDPVMAPESSKIGIDNRFALMAMKGNTDNELYKEVRNLSSGKLENHRAIDLYEKYVGFPDDLTKKDKKPTDMVSAVYKGKMVDVERSKLDFQIPTPHHLNAAATNNIPFLNAIQANRILMGAKHQSQALPLKYRDTRLVEPVISSLAKESITDRAGSFLIPKTPIDGTVAKITEDYIYIKGTDGKSYPVDYATHMPMASKTALHNNITVSVGDKVKKGDPLGDNTFTKDGKLALGKNLSIAYMPYKGYNHEDGVVASKSAAEKLTSIHTNTVQVALDKTSITGKQAYTQAFPTEFTPAQLSKLNDKGIVKKGEVLEKGDPLILVMGDASENRVNVVLGKLHRSLVNPFTDNSEVYEGDYPAKVVEVSDGGKYISVMLEVEKPVDIGDKVGGTYGNKGVVTAIIPDDEIVQDEEGKPVDLIFTSAGVTGRINPSQILETALGKIAAKTGKKYDIENYSHEDYVKFVRDELKKHKMSDKETLTDPETGKKIPGIFTGVQHIQKLHKTTDTNYSARGVAGAHDQDDAPVGSGDTGPKAMGGMEVNALLAHNARSFLKESTMLRGAKNSEFWNNFQYGGIPHFPNEKKTFGKFIATLKQAGINVEKKDDTLCASPLTDKDILEMSSGEIKNALRVDAKSAMPEDGGLFDPSTTGGLNGERWSHVTLAEPVINPVFEDCVSTLLGLSKKELQTRFENQGGAAIKKQLNALNIDKLLADTEKEMENPRNKGMALDKLVRKAKYLKALKAKNLKAGDAYVLSHVPVTPPTMRPISISKTGDLMPNDSNEFYKNLILNNQAFKDIKKEKGFLDAKRENRAALQQSVRELTGVVAPTSPHLKNRNSKGAIKFIAGDQPKHGFFQRKVIYSKMNLTGRGTIAPDETLGLDDIGLPEAMAWEMYTPFILKELVAQGYSARDAKEQVEERTDKAKDLLMRELDKRPVIVNRAPTLWKHSLQAVKPKIRDGKTIKMNTLWESSLGSDFDGDSSLNSVVFRLVNNADQDLTMSENSILFNSNSNTIKKDTDMPFANTALRYNEGLINLEDFPRIESSKRTEGNKDLYDVPEGVEILSVMNGKKAWLPVTEYSVHYDLNLVEVVTSTSRTIHCSVDDSLITVDKDLNYTKVQPAVGLTLPRLVEPLERPDNSSVLSQITVTENGHDPMTFALDRDFGWLAGAFVGDGWLNKAGDSSDSKNKNAVMVSKRDEDFREAWKSIIKSYFTKQHFTFTENPHTYEGLVALSHKLTCYNKVLAAYFRDNHSHSAEQKSLPYFWAKTSEEYRWGLLAGLIDSDGTVSEVSAKSKKSAQFIISYTSVSKSLIFEIVALANSLGLTATAYFAKITEAGKESWGVNFTIGSIIKMQKNLLLHHSKKKDRLAGWKVRDKTLDTLDGNKYTPSLTKDRLAELRKAIGCKDLYVRKAVNKKQVKTGELRVPEGELQYWKSRNTLYTAVSQCLNKEKPISAYTAKKIIALGLDLFNDPFWAKWKAMVEDTSIEWDLVKSMTPIPVTTAYDITAPPNYTMVTESGFVIQDTVQIHLPVTDEAIKEMESMYPSKQVFSDKKKGSLLMAPSQEPIVGLYTVTKNLGKGNIPGQVKRYKTEAEAWKAYYAGTLKMTDKVEIG